MTTRARDEIVEAAFRLFLERGYEATSLARILDTVPYSKGAVYHHFASKEALLEAVIERFFTSLLDPTDAPRPTEPIALAHRMVDDYVDAIDAVAPYASPTAYYAFLTSVAPRASEAIGAAHTASAAELAGALKCGTFSHREIEAMEALEAETATTTTVMSVQYVACSTIILPGTSHVKISHELGPVSGINPSR